MTVNHMYGKFLKNPFFLADMFAYVLYIPNIMSLLFQVGHYMVTFSQMMLNSFVSREPYSKQIIKNTDN